MVSMSKSSTSRFDQIVIGAGAAGLAAARSARRRGSVLLVESRRPGGDCTFTGCVPSKTLMETARRAAHVRKQDRRGITAQVAVDFTQVMQHVREMVEQIAADESPQQLREEGIHLLEGTAAFLSHDEIEVDGISYRAERFVLATGSRPLLPVIDGLADVSPLTNETVFHLTEAPRRLAIIGGGAVGCELAQGFARLAIPTLLLDSRERLLPDEEPEASAVVAEALTSDGVTITTGASVSRMSRGIRITLDNGAEEDASHVLVATGRRAETAALNLKAAGVETLPDGRIMVDDRGRTTRKHIVAAGDCAESLRFTQHVADEQGRQRASKASWPSQQRFRRSVVPWVTFTDPEVGRVGLTEQEAFQQYGERARIAYFPMAHSDRARCSDQTGGFVKLIAAPRAFVGSVGGGRLVGMTAVAAAGGEMIAEAAVVMRSGAMAGRLAQTIHAYPTWSLTVRQAAAA